MEQTAKNSGKPLDRCPTCHSSKIEVAPGVWGWENGTYVFRNVTYECNCEEQMTLYKHYLFAGIGDQYMRLNWGEYTGPAKVIESVDSYIDNWPSMKINGMGMEFSSDRLGVGKTFAATHIGKEIIKQGERVLFVDFREIVDLLNDPNYDRRTAREGRLKETTLLILDEVTLGSSEAQTSLFADRFELVVRHRQNYNRPTIITTNLTQDELNEAYPRIYSLLSAKQYRVVIEGEKDMRKDAIWERNEDLSLNAEVAPII